MISDWRLPIGAGESNTAVRGTRALQFGGDTGYPTPPILPNEAICNVEEYASIWVGEKGLHRLQKNDKWLRFPGNGWTRWTGWTLWTGRARTLALWRGGIFELMRGSGFSEGCWCGGRWFDRLTM